MILIRAWRHVLSLQRGLVAGWVVLPIVHLVILWPWPWWVGVLFGLGWYGVFPVVVLLGDEK